MLVFKLLFVSVCVLWTSEGVSVPPGLRENLKNNEDNLPQATFPFIQQFYHTDEQIANVDALDLFKSLNPNIQIGTADLLVSTTNPENAEEASKNAQTTPIVKPTEEVKTPTEDVKKPTEEVKQPTEDVKKPTDEVKKPTEEVNKPTEEVKKPTEEVNKPTEEVKKPNEELTKFYEDFLKDIEQNRYVPYIYENPTTVEQETTEPNHDWEKFASESKIQPQISISSQEDKPERRRKKSKRRKTKHPEDHEEATSYHESPGEIPTKPIYPGEGQWARRNVKHRPHISKHYDHPSKAQEDHQPEGKEVFDENRQIFNEERAIHQRNLHDKPEELLPETDNVQTPEFVPYRNYAQVRKSETKKRMPKRKKKKNKKNKRLKESIKDSKVHTIYTEEGYEDNAYDHGEQEKNAKRKEIEKNLQEETLKTHTDDVLPITRKTNKETYDDIAPQPPAPPEYHEEQTKEDGVAVESQSNENRDDKNEENQRDLKEENNGAEKENLREEETKEDNQQKRNDSVPINDGDQFDVKIDEAKYPKEEKKVEEKVEESQDDKKEKVFSTEKPKTTTEPPKRNIFDEDWFQKYKFDNIGDYYTDAFSTKNKKEEKQKSEESQQAPKEVKDDQIQEKVNSKEENGGDKKSKNIADQDWYQKYRLDGWEEYSKRESKRKPQKKSGKVEDNVKARDQDKEYDVPEQEEDKNEKQTNEKNTEKESENPVNAEKESENPEKQGEEPSDEDNMSQSGEEIKIYLNYPKEQVQEATEDKLIDSMVGETKFGEKITKYRRQRRSTDEKFPYYKSEELDTASSLRYAENLNNIPVKKKGVMTFYDKADKTDCPETTEVNPVPDKIGATKDSNETKTNSTDKPRLEGRLGDQIDCMKSKYFGDNPLDNPLFSEENVEVPTSIFKDEEDYDYDDEKGDEDNKRQPKSSEHQVEEANSTDTSEGLPKAEKYILRRKVVKKRRRYPYPPREHRPEYYRPTYQPSYQPSYQPPYQPSYQPSYNPEPSVLMPYPSQPNEPQWSTLMVHVKEPSKKFSEVHYKEEIQPNEQLNVFADIINNIKHSNGDSASQESSVEEIAIIRRPNRNKYKGHYFVSTTTNKPFLPTPVQEKEEKRFTKRIPSSILPGHKDADEIIIVKQPPMQGNFKPYFPKQEENFVPTVDQQSTKHRPPTYAQQPSNHVYQTQHHGSPTRAQKVEEIEENGPLDNLEITTNNYYFLGMRPPPEFPYSHPNFYDVDPPTEKKKKRRNSRPKRRRRVKRSNNRRGYAEISRGGRKEDEIGGKVEEEEEDDYVPHRPKTFHYDEKTGKIVYDKKQEEPVEYDEVEYVEVEEATHPPKKKKEELKRFPPTPPPGPSYLDFIKVLKTNPNYTVIEDPKPKEDKKKEQEEETTTASIRSVVTPTGVPEFLQILAKVKTDKAYEIILDPTPEPKKKKTTTPPPEEPDIEQSEEIETEVQNSPGLQGILGMKSGLQVFDISEFVPKTRDYSPRTSIDTSKYTVIRRNHAKAENAEKEEEPQAERVVMEAIATTTQASRTIEIPTTSIRSTTPYKEAAPTTVQSKRVVLRGRRRSTTPSPTTKGQTNTTATPERRQRGRSRYRTTTQVPDAPLEETVRNRRNLHPRNHRREYAETRNDISNILRVKPTPRSISLNIINQMDLKKLVNNTKPNEETTVPNEDVEVFKDYDPEKKHGGNYKYKKVVINTRITNYKPLDEEETGEKGTKEDVEKSGEYFKDPKLPEQINGLKEKKYEITETIFEEENDGDNQDFFDDSTTEETSTRKLPNIIKDPSKRLYFYAPL